MAIKNTIGPGRIFPFIGVLKSFPGQFISIYRRHTACTLAGVALLISGCIFEKYTTVIEQLYSRQIYLSLLSVFSLPGKYLTEISVSEIVCGGIVLVVILRIICKIMDIVRNPTSAGSVISTFTMELLAGVSTVYILFIGIWGFNYYRQPFSAAYGLKTSENLASAEYNSALRDLALELNRYRKEIPVEMGMDEMDQKVDAALDKIFQETYHIEIGEFPPTKFLFFNEYMNVVGINGFFIPGMMEPHINADLPLWEKPVIIAHEKAHFMGFSSETDATLISYIACLSSDSAMLRYSGGLYMFLRSYHYVDDAAWREAAAQLSEPIKSDIRELSERIHKNKRRYAKTQALGSLANDTLLKMNHQRLGVQSYNAAAPLAMIWWNARRTQR